MICPECGSECERDEVDVGVGTVAAGPWGCPACHWAEPDDPMLIATGEDEGDDGDSADL